MNILDIGLYLFYVLLLVAIALCIVFPIVYAIKNPKTFAKSAVGVGALAIIFVIAYSLSGSEFSLEEAALGVNATSSKLIGAGMLMMYFAYIAAAVTVVYAEISKALK